MDEALHGEDGEIAVEDLDWVVEDLAFDGLSLLVLLLVFCVYLGVPLDEESSVVFMDQVLGLSLLHPTNSIISSHFSFISEPTDHSSDQPRQSPAQHHPR